MDCPKCGAANPADAAHCNLCLTSFVDKPAAPAAPPQKAVPSAGGIMSPAKMGSEDVPRQIAVRGGVAAVAGGYAFLLSLGILQLAGVDVGAFVFASIGINQPNLSFFILLACMFTFVSGGVGGNLRDKRDAVPAVRLLAVLIGLGLWVGLLYLVKPAQSGAIIWLTSTTAGTVISLTAFPLAALFLGLSELFGSELDLAEAGYGAVGGLIAGLIAGLAAWLASASAPLFGSAVPSGWVAVWAFSLKLALVVGVAGFVSSAALWFAIVTAERYSA